MRYRRYHRKKKQKIKFIISLCVFILIIVVIVKVSGVLSNLERNDGKVISEAPEFTVDLLTYNDYSRPGIATEEINGIVVHYTANPGSTADENRDYFEGLKDSHITKASSHFIIGMEGEIVQCVPTNEIAYASNERNLDTISIECCHPDATGKFTRETYDSLVELTAWLCGKFQLSSENIIRHYDVTGKACPLYYVENEDAWEDFKQDVQDYIDKHGEKVQ